MEQHRDMNNLPRLRLEAEHWRKCAADTRHAARRMGLIAARRRMVEIAEEYDRLAELAERIAAQG
jgi:hypothetical protein